MWILTRPPPRFGRAKRSGGAPERYLGRNAERAKNAQHEIGRDVLGVPIEQSGDARARGSRKRSHLSVGEPAFPDHLNDLGVERASDRNLDACSPIETKNFSKLTGGSCDDCFDFLF